MKENNLERLYKLLERAEREKDTETAAALRWAIFISIHAPTRGATCVLP